MCGIAGYCYNNQILDDKRVCEEMLAAIKHRGPDADGIYQAEKIRLIHSRLAVVDLENGKQPMIFHPGEKEKVIIYNGELYNTDEIRCELINLGYKFKGYSDTEVILISYVEWGAECIKKMNGIFAFAIWDREEQKLFVARDRMGVKPFFYFADNNEFVFASEIKALLKHPSIEPIMNKTTLAEILLLGPGRTPGNGVFKNIFELLPGYCGFFQKNIFTTYPYWLLKAREHTDNFNETVERVKFLVTDAIKRQTVSDVPLASFLSGGLDSSAIVAISGVKKTFSVDYEENEKFFKSGKFQPDSDNKYVTLMSNFLGVPHERIILQTNDLVSSLFEAAEERDLPGMADVDGSLLLFCKSVKEKVTVALSGECADEVFGGYPWFRDKDIRETDGFPWSQSTLYRASFLRDELINFNPAEYVYSKYSATKSSVSVLQNDTALEKRMKEMFKLNVDWFMQTLLDRKDRMSMRWGLEVRVPFCDHRIVEYLYNVPWEYKNYNNREKGLLRMALSDVLPNEILWRKKSPYPKTHHPQYLKAVSSILLSIINDKSSPLLQLIKKEKLQQLLEDNYQTPWYGQLMTTPQTIAYFIQFNHWLKHYRVKLEL